ncbi:MAG: SAM-dependent methyltransferase, partial [Chlamydiia bacterium]|nr:SAM-dependent methyltransferase [Chlamydiia bacterium]
MTYFLITLGVLFLILLLLLLFTWKNGISPMPTSQKMRDLLFSHLPEIENGTVVELGSGWGNLAI